MSEALMTGDTSRSEAKPVPASLGGVLRLPHQLILVSQEASYHRSSPS